ncbi:protein IQ-DOMAIN 1 [Cucurbita pepo subsp. pepo]|uniref:protein IQ-DOMAIN 1 n=1 Tax=Cucurbita pepo subsp. pepo TaxID=3664 RepID=UPI000C9D607F|nr:protein IQ-DOMAIN 1 [Cucurbita pepo subsp. pepo]
MGITRNWFRRVRRRLSRKGNRDIVFLQTNAEEEQQQDEIVYDSIVPSFQKKALCLEEVAAIKIQTCFRGHLARRAFRALRSLVKLQALARGVCARRQARIALQFMHTLARLQVRVRTRQLVSRYSEESDC